jgi:hypothetical protein
VARKLRSDPKQLSGVVTQDRSPVFVAQPRHSKNVVHGIVLPSEGEIGSQNDSADADLRD